MITVIAPEYLILSLSTLVLIAALLWHNKNQRALQRTLMEELKQIRLNLKEEQQQQQGEKLFTGIVKNQQLVTEALQQFSQHSTQMQQQHTHNLQTTLRENFRELEKHVHQITLHLSDKFNQLNQSTQQHLMQISEAVESRLVKGFEKTNETFINIIQRLAVIDEAQRKITDLSKNVISLQEILNDKRSRGAFGEVQLNVLIQNVLPTNSYALQHTLSNGMRADCLLLLPEPTGNIVIDAKFPLENFKKFVDNDNSEFIKTTAKQQFKLDIRKHIQDVSQKYIIPGETGEGALIFIPAEAIFAEIHAHHPDLVEYAWQAKVWLASPSTMMAVLTTACAVLKDCATRQQIHVIQDHLRLLAQDFSRFEKRMDNLARHLQQANVDAEQISTSAQKIAKRFQQIDNVQLPPTVAVESLVPESTPV